MPTYDSFPAGCSVGPFSYGITLSSAGNFPIWITENPIDSIKMATSENINIGTYTFKLIVTDFTSGLSNDDVTFTFKL